MDWLSQNWIWIALAVGAFFLMSRMHGMGSMGGCGTGRSARDNHPADTEDNVPPAPGNRPGSLFDPVSGRAFAAGNAPISTVYRGRAYYFESRDDRDAFEAEPERYLAATGAAGQAIGSEEAYRDRPRRRHGGC